ncbi:hypothetical protein K2X30_02055 [bacterium]|jgi:hypothetical protein|nr:hypothetical protein [bacterium]
MFRKTLLSALFLVLASCKQNGDSNEFGFEQVILQNGTLGVEVLRDKNTLDFLGLKGLGYGTFDNKTKTSTGLIILEGNNTNLHLEVGKVGMNSKPYILSSALQVAFFDMNLNLGIRFKGANAPWGVFNYQNGLLDGSWGNELLGKSLQVKATAQCVYNFGAPVADLAVLQHNLDAGVLYSPVYLDEPLNREPLLNGCKIVVKDQTVHSGLSYFTFSFVVHGKISANMDSIRVRMGLSKPTPP